jgi:hypothetical protein
MLVLMGCFITEIGCLASAITDNQIVAAIVGFSAILSLLFIGLLAFFIPTSGTEFRELV